MTVEKIEQTSGFAALGITGSLLKAATDAGFETPKPIQAQAIPQHMAGRDILGIAQTGSGKTAAFAMPILSKIIGLGTRRQPRTARALILAPTRELAVQIEEVIRVLAKGAHISTALVLGGVSRFSQVKKLQPGVDFLIATPGRLTDLVREGDVKLGETKWLVLDEADRMLDMGFINDVRRLAKATHPQRQTALFSATMPNEIEDLALALLRDPVTVSVARQGTTAAEISQGLIKARTRQKRAVLAGLLADPALSSVIVFSRTKHGADKIARQLEQDGFEAGVIHGNKSQNARQKALNGFRDGELRILVATDIAARGIDVPGISHVVNYDLPDEPESYVHRIGRTGRNGASGASITLCAPEEAAKLRSVEKVIRKPIPLIADRTGDPDPAPAPRTRGSDGDGQRRAQPAARASHGERAASGERRAHAPAANKGPRGDAGHAKKQAAGAPKQRNRRRRRRFGQGGQARAA